MGKSTISMAIFNSYVSHHQRVVFGKPSKNNGGMIFLLHSELLTRNVWELFQLLLTAVLHLWILPVGNQPTWEKGTKLNSWTLGKAWYGRLDSRLIIPNKWIPLEDHYCMPGLLQLWEFFYILLLYLVGRGERFGTMGLHIPYEILYKWEPMSYALRFSDSQPHDSRPKSGCQWYY